MSAIVFRGTEYDISDRQGVSDALKAGVHQDVITVNVMNYNGLATPKHLSSLIQEQRVFAHGLDEVTDAMHVAHNLERETTVDVDISPTVFIRGGLAELYLELSNGIARDILLFRNVKGNAQAGTKNGVVIIPFGDNSVFNLLMEAICHCIPLRVRTNAMHVTTGTSKQIKVSDLTSIGAIFMRLYKRLDKVDKVVTDKCVQGVGLVQAAHVDTGVFVCDGSCKDKGGCSGDDSKATRQLTKQQYKFDKKKAPGSPLPLEGFKFDDESDAESECSIATECRDCECDMLPASYTGAASLSGEFSDLSDVPTCKSAGGNGDNRIVLDVSDSDDDGESSSDDDDEDGPYSVSEIRCGYEEHCRVMTYKTKYVAAVFDNPPSSAAIEYGVRIAKATHAYFGSQNGAKAVAACGAKGKHPIESAFAKNIGVGGEARLQQYAKRVTCFLTHDPLCGQIGEALVACFTKTKVTEASTEASAAFHSHRVKNGTAAESLRIFEQSAAASFVEEYMLEQPEKKKIKN
jgi:hypothetical protein